MTTINSTITERRHVTDRRTLTPGAGSHRMAAAEWIPMLLLIIGGLNWALVGLFDFNLVAYLFGEMTSSARIVYVLVGICALYSIYLSAKMSSKTH